VLRARSLAPRIREIRDQSFLWPAEVTRTSNGADESNRKIRPIRQIRVSLQFW